MHGLFEPLGPWFFDPLPPHGFNFISIDPPWWYDLYSEAGEEKSAGAQYDLMRDEEVLRLPVRQLADVNCLLYCWGTAPRLDFQIECVKAWGFTYLSLMFWEKVTVNGKMRWGTGYRVRTTAEPIIVASIGNPKQGWVPPTQFKGIAREHSRKPEEFYPLCERVMPRARRADIFSRQNRPGWSAWGREAGLFDIEGASPRRKTKPAPIAVPDMFRGDAS